MIKILHTSDWHLGKRLDQNERIIEHHYFLDWLIETISFHQIDVLIVAGDIFDTGNPSNAALKLYYDFLWKVKNTSCKYVIITGGNHDSVSTLDAPKELLSHFNVYVSGGIPDQMEDQIIPIRNKNGNIELVVCAVPFLRDRDIRLSIPGETSEERESRIKEGIVNHYRDLIPYIKEYKEENIPVVATGHLFAAGSHASPDSEKEIHVGNLGQISGSHFPEEFNYIALGHLHRPQIVNNMSHIRYSGSPIPLSFSENEDQKSVLIVSFGENETPDIKSVTIPCYRKLIRIKGSLDKVKTKLSLIENEDMEQLPIWVEIQVETENFIPDLPEQLNAIIAENHDIEQLFIKQIKLRQSLDISEQLEDIQSLHDLTPLNVFIKKCESEFPDENYNDLIETFSEALELMEQDVNEEK